jgi:hypothetical protein
MVPILIASDLIITKGNRNTLFESHALGRPSISISFGLNPIDDYRVLRIPSNTALRARGLTAHSLRDHMEAALRKMTDLKAVPESELSANRKLAAVHLHAHIARPKAPEMVVST